MNTQSLAQEVPVSTAKAEIGKTCFQANVESKKAHRYISQFYYVQSMSFIVCNTSSILLLEGNMPETGLIAFVTRKYQLST